MKQQLIQWSSKRFLHCVYEEISFLSLQLKRQRRPRLRWRRRGEDGFDDVGMDADGTVVGCRCCVGIRCGSRETAGKMEASRSRFSLAFREIVGVIVDVEAHVAGVEANDGFRMGSALVEAMDDGLGSGFSPLCLDGCECAKGDEEDGVGL